MLNRLQPLGHLQQLATLVGGIIPSRTGYSPVLYLLLKLSVTEDGLTAEAGLTDILLWKWHIIYPTSYLDEVPLN